MIHFLDDTELTCLFKEIRRTSKPFSELFLFYQPTEDAPEIDAVKKMLSDLNFSCFEECQSQVTQAGLLSGNPGESGSYKAEESNPDNSHWGPSNIYLRFYTGPISKL